MDDKTAELRDIFIDTTGSNTVTENQEQTHGSLADESNGKDVDDRLHELVATMRERYDFDTDFDDATLVRIVRKFHDDADDAAIAATVDADESAVFAARMDLHLVDDADQEAPFDLDELRSRFLDGVDTETCAAELGVDAETVRRYRPVVEAETEAIRANDRFRDEFEELLTDSALTTNHAADAREDGLREATEDIETDVSF